MKGRHIRNRRGFTLVEVVVAIGFFSLLLLMSSLSFQRIVAGSAKYSKMEENNIAGVVGLEIMRHDVEQMGFGLPWGWAYLTGGSPPLTPCGLYYEEATDTTGAQLNDAHTNVPRPFVGFAQANALGSAYFAIKATNVGRTIAGPANPPGSTASQYWTYINYSGSATHSRPARFASNNPSPNDRVLVINSSPDFPLIDRSLVVGPLNTNLAATNPPSFFTLFKTDYSMDPNFLPVNGNAIYMVYDILGNGDKTPAGADIDNPRMPFNRVDFFVDSGAARYCASNTGTLVKATVNHGSSGGDYDKVPLLDCVADMEVVLGWDPAATPSASGSVGAYSNLPTLTNPLPSSSGAGISQSWFTDASLMRSRLKLVKIYILAQVGKKDPQYTSPSPIEVGDQSADGISPKKNYTLTGDQLHYHWKVYRIIARPRNLLSNSF